MTTSIAFCDSSVLTSLFIEESASPWARSMAERFTPAVWWAARVEIHSAIARVHRSGELDAVSIRQALGRMHAMYSDWLEIVPSDGIRDLSEAVLDQYPLRAADALQLAAALVWCRERPKGRNFLCADERLCDAAEKAGFTVLRPEG